MLILWLTVSMVLTYNVCSHTSNLQESQANSPQEIFQDQNAEHLGEHLKDFGGKNVTDMSSDEQSFYYFKLHDVNNDNVLDGLELLWLLRDFTKPHANDTDAENNANSHEMNSRTIEELTRLTDKTLSLLDFNGDGAVSYSEVRQQTKETT
ncbi:unnamed protein product [Didymodactylos carnosus]|uniref:EF-hand domain-containing protein n=1 Tax=Didymodactylos carnosus TaxID=1234261 RepID=A0A8S2VRL4_9BILA|nr:unnamed protein product [Didymodactylos carnosus]CAF4396791.1 unnamed protein product [Didymodactylos carnosus]